MPDTTTAVRLKQIMEERNLRQVDIVRLCQPFCEKYHLKLTKSDLSQFVSGKVIPGQWKISILAYALDVSESWLMGYDVPQARPPVIPSEKVQQIIAEYSEAECELLAYFRSLNEPGRAALISTASALADNPAFQSSPPIAQTGA